MTHDVTRRSFLAAAAGSALAARAAAQTTAPAAAAPRAIRIAVKLGMVVGSMSLRAKFQRLRESGFHGVEDFMRFEEHKYSGVMSIDDYIDNGCTCPVLYPLGDPKLMIDIFSDGYR